MLFLLLALPADLPYDLRVDAPLTLTATTVWLGSEAMKGSLVDECRWCDGNDVDDAARDALRWDDTGTADLASNIALVATLPATVGVLASEGRFHELPVDVLVIAEATTLAAAVNQVVKLSLARQRPFAHHTLHRAHEADDDLSFYSGHTSLAFALLTSTATVASMRGYAIAPWIWAAGAPLAAATAYFRVAADKHWLSDVVVGAAAGAAIGVAVPLLLHHPRTANAARGETVVMLAFAIP